MKKKGKAHMKLDGNWHWWNKMSYASPLVQTADWISTCQFRFQLYGSIARERGGGLKYIMVAN